jgi:patatin-like phospholipase/acyl hydrolase
MAKFRILSMDGGGIRGIITVVFLQRLSREPGLEGWLDRVNLLAGTSTGGLIALGLAAGKSLESIRAIYETDASKIFETSVWHEITHLGNIFGAKYDIENLEEVLKTFLGEGTTLGSLAKLVLITSFDLDGTLRGVGRTWKPKLFHNFGGGDSDVAELAWKVGLYTSAAPTYFQPVDGFVDGGIYASNPSMCALAQSQDSRFEERAPIEDVVLLSLGTGTSRDFIRPQQPDWGAAQWIKPLISIMLDGVAGIADYECDKILNERYQRLSPPFPGDTSIEMDAIDQIPYMVHFAEQQDVSEIADWIRKWW